MSLQHGPCNFSHACCGTQPSALNALVYLHVAMLLTLLKTQLWSRHHLLLNFYSVSRTCRIKFKPLSVMFEVLDHCLQAAFPGVSAATPLNFLPQQSG